MKSMKSVRVSAARVLKRPAGAGRGRDGVVRGYQVNVTGSMSGLHGPNRPSRSKAAIAARAAAVAAAAAPAAAPAPLEAGEKERCWREGWAAAILCFETRELVSFQEREGIL